MHKRWLSAILTIALLLPALSAQGSEKGSSAEGLSPWDMVVRAAEQRLQSGPAPTEPVTQPEAAYMASRLTEFKGANG